MSKISNIKALEVLDSMGQPTLEIEVVLECGIISSSIVPSDSSNYNSKVIQLRDKDHKRYFGQGVLKAIQNVEEKIKPKLQGIDVLNQRMIDDLLLQMDGSENKSKIGANALLGVSMSCAKAAANYLKIPLYRYLGGVNSHILPTPIVNMINIASHHENMLDFKEFMIIPIDTTSFKEAIRMTSEVFYHLKKLLEQNEFMTTINIQAVLESNEMALQYLVQAIEQAGYLAGIDAMIGLNIASEEFYKDGKYHLKNNDKPFSSNELIEYYENLISKYPILSIEDGMATNDELGWQELTSRLGYKIQLVGANRFITCAKKLSQGISEKQANSILIQLSQSTTISEVIDLIELARRNHYTVIISQSFGESEETFIADLAVALNIGQIKTGSPSNSDRVSKYNRLLKIERNLYHQAIYQGKNSIYCIKYTNN